jgi:hypothetical protein
MATTYEALYTTTLTATQSSVTFNSFSGYTDLICIATPIISGGTAYNLNGYFNSDYTGNSYSALRLSGVGSGSGSTDIVTDYPVLLFSGAVKVQTTLTSQFILQVFNYSNSTTHKMTLCRGSNASTGVDEIVNTWRSTSPITSFTLNPDGAASFASGSTFTLYGIKAA